MQAGIEVGTILLKSEIGVGYSILNQTRDVRFLHYSGKPLKKPYNPKTFIYGGQDNQKRTRL
jgi:hypothetical protein